MGCDIHIYAEYKKGRDWSAVIEERFPNPYYTPGTASEWNTPKILEPYSGRNYYLFGLLTEGNARCDHGERWNTFEMRYDLPDDCSRYIRGAHAEWSDAHSTNWITLKELLEWKHWDEYVSYSDVHRIEGEVDPMVRQMILSQKELFCARSNNLLENTETVSISKCNGPFIKFNSTNEAIGAIRGFAPADWKIRHRDNCERFYDKTIPDLSELAKDKGVETDSVRIVFWFDS